MSYIPLCSFLVHLKIEHNLSSWAPERDHHTKRTGEQYWFYWRFHRDDRGVFIHILCQLPIHAVCVTVHSGPRTLSSDIGSSTYCVTFGKLSILKFYESPDTVPNWNMVLMVNNSCVILNNLNFKLFFFPGKLDILCLYHRFVVKIKWDNTCN